MGNDDCSVCWMPMVDAARVQCGHTFCPDCIEACMRRSTLCPLCIRPIEKVAVEIGWRTRLRKLGMWFLRMFWYAGFAAVVPALAATVCVLVHKYPLDAFFFVATLVAVAWVTYEKWGVLPKRYAAVRADIILPWLVTMLRWTFFALWALYFVLNLMPLVCAASGAVACVLPCAAPHFAEEHMPRVFASVQNLVDIWDVRDQCDAIGAWTDHFFRH